MKMNGEKKKKKNKHSRTKNFLEANDTKIYFWQQLQIIYVAHNIIINVCPVLESTSTTSTHRCRYIEKKN